MNKIIFLISITSFFYFNSNAQQSLYLEILSDTYEEINNPISLSNGNIWDDPEYVVPVGFDFELFGNIQDSLFFGDGLGGNLFMYPEEVEGKPMLIPYSDDLVDRGYHSNIAQSDIAYVTEGTVGNRVFKLQWKNAGFYDEISELDSSYSFVNFQLWIYEEDNAIEMRYGTSDIVFPELVFFNGEGPIIGFIDSLQQAGEFFKRFYYLEGSAELPILQTAPAGVDIDTISTFLIGSPPEGIVYRFTDMPVSTSSLDSFNHLISIYPTITRKYLNVTYSDLPYSSILPYSIYTLNGQEIVTAMLPPNGQIELPYLAAGYYYLKIEMPDGKSTSLPFLIY